MLFHPIGVKKFLKDQWLREEEIERLSVEEGLLAKPESNSTTSCDCSNTVLLSPLSNSSTTVVICSTLVAVCGSFSFGFAVNGTLGHRQGSWKFGGKRESDFQEKDVTQLGESESTWRVDS